MGRRNIFQSTIPFLFVCCIGFISTPVKAAVKKYQFDVSRFHAIIFRVPKIVFLPNFLLFYTHFQIQVKNISRLCHAKPIVTVNGMFPGPTVYAREGDRVLINVTNYARYNMSIHWYEVEH